MLCAAFVAYGSTASSVAAQQPRVAARTLTESTRAVQDLLARRVTVTLTNIPMKQAIDSVSRLTRVFIEYQAPMLMAYTRPVTLSVTDTPLGVVLERILDGTALRVMGGTPGGLMLMSASSSDSTPSRAVGIISGRVIDSASGRGLGGAKIKVVGTKISVVTVDSGGFTLRDVPVGDQAVMVRLFGYRATQRIVAVTERGRTTVRIPLSSVPNVWSGGVTPATGHQR
jgi:hypothetical protein